MREFGIGALLFGLFMLGVSIIVGWQFGLAKVFAPAYEELRTEVFEESRAHIEGTNLAVARLRLEYLSTENSVHQSILREAILSEVASIDRNQLRPEIRSFIEGIE